MSATQLDLWGPPVSQVRRHDPRTAKAAAGMNREGRASQATRLLLHLLEHHTVTADYAHRHLTLEAEDVTRGEWSTRIGVLIHRGLVERAGEVNELDRRGKPRAVLSYRLTDAGRDEAQRLASSLMGGEK